MSVRSKAMRSAALFIMLNYRGVISYKVIRSTDIVPVLMDRIFNMGPARKWT